MKNYIIKKIKAPLLYIGDTNPQDENESVNFIHTKV